MEDNEWYGISDIAGHLGLKITRTKELVYDLVEQGKLIDDGVTKGKKYKKV